MTNEKMPNDLAEGYIGQAKALAASHERVVEAVKTELLPCPFCGASSEALHVGVKGMSIVSYVECQQCLASQSGYDTKDEAIAAWNTRVARQEPRWIPVGERLPETPDPWPVQVWAVILIAGRQFYQSAKFYKNEWTDDEGRIIEDDLAIVIAWQPIAPYTPEEQK